MVVEQDMVAFVEILMFHVAFICRSFGAGMLAHMRVATVGSHVDAFVVIIRITVAAFTRTTSTVNKLTKSGKIFTSVFENIACRYLLGRSCVKLFVCQTGHELLSSRHSSVNDLALMMLGFSNGRYCILTSCDLVAKCYSAVCARGHAE